MRVCVCCVKHTIYSVASSFVYTYINWLKAVRHVNEWFSFEIHIVIKKIITTSRQGRCFHVHFVLRFSMANGWTKWVAYFEYFMEFYTSGSEFLFSAKPRVQNFFLYIEIENGADPFSIFICTLKIYSNLIENSFEFEWTQFWWRVLLKNQTKNEKD